MMRLPPPPPPFVRAYQHVRTENKEWHSICLRCHMMAACAPKTGDLDTQEQEHICFKASTAPGCPHNRS